MSDEIYIFGLEFKKGKNCYHAKPDSGFWKMWQNNKDGLKSMGFYVSKHPELGYKVFYRNKEQNKMVENTLLEQTEKERDEFLKKNPHMIKYQQEINLMLIGVEDPTLRLLLIMKKISQNAGIQKNKIGELKEEFNKIVSHLKMFKGVTSCM